MSDPRHGLPRSPRGSEKEGFDAVLRMLAGRRIAVVGLSDDPSRPSYAIAAYLAGVGKEVVPVNPNYRSVMGLTAYPTLQAVPGPVDVVNVFRRAGHCAEIVRAAVSIGASGVWLQSGVISDDAARVAREAGIDFVQDRCIKIEHMFNC